MNKMMSAFGTLYKWVCAFVLALMVIIVFMNTLLRYGFHSGIVETEELLRYLFVFISFLGIVTVYYQHQHIAVTTITDMLSPKAARIFTFLTNFLVLYALYVFIDGCFMFIGESATSIGQVTKIPYVWIISVGVFAGVSCFGIVVRDMYLAVRCMINEKQSTPN